MNTSKRFALLLLILACTAHSESKLGLADIHQLLRSGLSGDKIAQIVEIRGVSFDLSGTQAEELIGEGASASLPQAIRAKYASLPAAKPATENPDAKRLGDEAQTLFDKKQYIEAKQSAEAGVRAGSTTAMVTLGRIYSTGNGAQRDFTAANDWFRKAADLGNGAAMNGLGDSFSAGNGVARDYAEALRWYHKADETGYLGAADSIGQMYSSGRGVERDDAVALEWHRKSAEGGGAAGMNFLGLFYMNGTGVTRDYAEAMRWYRKAADAGFPSAKYNIGLMYDNGRGVPKDFEEALRWYRLAAEAGNAPGMTSTGHMYQVAAGVGKDYAQASQWYRKAIEAGDARAMLYLGLLYENGHAIGESGMPETQDSSRAFQWFEKAAKSGNAAGMYQLALAYENGRGTDKDAAAARQWFEKASAGGSSDAEAWLQAKSSAPGSTNPDGAGGGVFRIGGGVSQPAVIYKVDPEYSEKARKAHYSGTVMLAVIVDSGGRARDIHVVKSLGMGLDEKAMEAVAKWKFKPGMKDGQPVNVRATIEVNFRFAPNPPQSLP
jgi:uncharacterized protein